MDMVKMKYNSTYANVDWKFVQHFKPGKLQNLAMKNCAYKIRSTGGGFDVGLGRLAYLESKYKEPHKSKNYDFNKYSVVGPASHSDDSSKFDYKNVNFIDDRNEYNPVQTDTSDSDYTFDDDDAIISNSRKRKK